jgi:hypothetical protein
MSRPPGVVDRLRITTPADDRSHADDDDSGLLREMSQGLSPFEGHLPSAVTGLRFERLRLQNTLALDGLTSEGGRYPGFGLLLPRRAIAAWHLWQEGDSYVTWMV